MNNAAGSILKKRLKKHAATCESFCPILHAKQMAAKCSIPGIVCLINAKEELKWRIPLH